METKIYRARMAQVRIAALSALVTFAAVGLISSASAYTPVLHLRKTSTAPPLVTKLQDPATAAAWYPASPTWFGMGGKTGDRNHTEILATYDDSALYIALLDIDRSTFIYPKGTTTDITTVDSDAIWIETPAGRRFYLLTAMDNNYPPGSRQASGEFPTFDPKSDRLTGWSHTGWYAGDKTIQQTIKIPWSTLHTGPPVAGSRWRINFVNYNQTSSTLSSSTVKRQMWAPGTETQPSQWGTIAFDEAAFTPPTNTSPEAIVTLCPATGYGDEVTLRAGNQADVTNGWPNEAITQSNWNDWDPIDYTIKEFLQFDLSMIPPGRKIISATLQNHFRGHFESSPTDLYLHVIGLESSYDPKTVTGMTSPRPVENGFRRLVTTAEVKNWIDFDVTDVVTRAFDSGSNKAAFALAGSSGDIHNGKIWDVSFGRSDYYDKYRPKLIITFGVPNTTYAKPLQLGSGNYTSVAVNSSKNKLTNGTFRYGTVEGYSNTTYWLDPGSVSINSVNTRLMLMSGDTNPKTGHPAIRFMTPVNWKSIKQTATGLTGGKTYTFSGWYKGSASGIKSDIRLDYLDANGASLASGQAVYSGSGNWEQVKLTKAAPSGTVNAKVEIVNWTSGAGAYMLYSDLQLEEGSSPTAYSETMGVFYPDHPRSDGVLGYSNENCIGALKKLTLGASIGLSGRIVTGAFSGYFYIQCPEVGHKNCGIKVVSATNPAVRSMVDVTGTLSHDANDELIINSSNVSASSSGTDPKALGCSPRYIGGGTRGMAQGPDGGVGVNMVGVLQTTWGKVSGLVQNSSMLIDDGSRLPVKVIGPTGLAVNGSFVRITGISSIEKSGGGHIRVIRTRLSSDVIVIR